MRLLKIDSIHPIEYLNSKRAAWEDEYNNWSRIEYYNKLVALRCNFSDFYTYNLQQQSWQAEELFINDWLYIYKLAKEMYGKAYAMKRMINTGKQNAGFVEIEWKLKVLRDYIEYYKPDVIFCREHTNIPGWFWKPYRKKIFLVSRLSAHLPNEWSPLDFDLIYTDLPYYRDFFEYNKVETLYNHHGFDERILSEIHVTEKKHDVVFIGGLGHTLFSKRTSFMASLAAGNNYHFEWWGYYSGQLEDALLQAYRGQAAGLDMFNIYHNSKIVVNDYIDMAGGVAVNQRIFEVMGAGSLLLTRESASMTGAFPEGSFVTYSSAGDCMQKISYYLQHEDERAAIAAKGQQAVLMKYNYKDLMKLLSEQLKERIKNK